MKILKLSELLKERAQPIEKTFIEKMEDDLEYEDVAKSALNQAFERLDNVKITSVDEFIEKLKDSISVDETELSGFTLDQQLDLCIYGQEQGINEDCPTVDWNTLSSVIWNNAVISLGILAENIINREFLDDLSTFIEENDIQGAKINVSDTLGYYPAERIKSIENGEIREYRNIDGDSDIDQLVFNKFGQTLYFNLRV